MSYAFKLSRVLPASPAEIYEAWLSSAAHTAMTGGEAKASKRTGAAYSAWDGYITGRNLELVAGERIVQTWRTSEFPDDHPDSTITVELRAVKEGTRLTLTHEGVPDGQTSYETNGWEDFYFSPMIAYFDHARESAARSAKHV